MDNLELKSFVEEAYKSDLEFEKRGNLFFLTLNDTEIDVTELIKESAPHILNMESNTFEDAEFFPDLSLDAEFETKEDSENYGQIPGEPHVPYEKRTYVEITSTNIFHCQFELSQGSDPLFKVDFRKQLDDKSNTNFRRELENIIEDIQNNKN